MLESISKSAQERKLLGLLEVPLGELGLRVVDLECRLGPRSVVRVFIDHTPQSGGVSLEDCTRATRALEPVLEEKEAEVGLPGAYDLEVSSPGLDRRMRLVEDFQAALGCSVKLKIKKGSLEGRGSALRGELLDVESGVIIMAVDNQKVRIPLENILQATRLWAGADAGSKG